MARRHCKESWQGVMARSHCKESLQGVIARSQVQGVMARSHCKESLQGVIARSHCKESLQGVIARSHCKESWQGLQLALDSLQVQLALDSMHLQLALELESWSLLQAYKDMQGKKHPTEANSTLAFLLERCLEVQALRCRWSDDARPLHLPASHAEPVGMPPVVNIACSTITQGMRPHCIGLNWSCGISKPTTCLMLESLPTTRVQQSAIRPLCTG